MENRNEYIDGRIEALGLMDKLNLLATIEIAKALGEKFPEFEKNRFNAGAKHIDGYLTLLK